MKILALYDTGETLCWDDRVAIWHLRALPWPVDHLNFLSRYGGDGEFAGIMRVENLKTIIKPILTSIGDVQVAGLDDGSLLAVWHVDRYLFEFKHRVDAKQDKVFTTFGDVLEWALAKSHMTPSLSLYDQFVMPHCSFSRVGNTARIDDQWFCKTVGDDLSVTGIFPEMALRFSAKAGVLFKLDDFGRGVLHYRLDCKCVRHFKREIEAQGFTHPPNPQEDYYLNVLSR